MRRLYFSLMCSMLAIAAPPVAAQTRMNAVASFSILGDFVRNVGGDRVNVATLVGPDGDVHVYTPAPEDAKRIADAKLVVINGFGLEGWLPRLVAIFRRQGDHGDRNRWHRPAQARLGN